MTEPLNGRKRIAARPRRIPKETVSGMVNLETKEQLIALAELDERTVAFVVGKIIEIGLPIYRQKVEQMVA